MNQQGKELVVDKLGKILIVFFLSRGDVGISVWACTLASRCGPDDTLFSHPENQPSVPQALNDVVLLPKFFCILEND